MNFKNIIYVKLQDFADIMADIETEAYNKVYMGLTSDDTKGYTSSDVDGDGYWSLKDVMNWSLPGNQVYIHTVHTYTVCTI